jgi:hypothetical protein
MLWFSAGRPPGSAHKSTCTENILLYAQSTTHINNDFAGRKIAFSQDCRTFAGCFASTLQAAQLSHGSPALTFGSLEASPIPALPFSQWAEAMAAAKDVVAEVRLL